MILVDTSIWIDHLRGGDDELANVLNSGQVLMHAFVLGELTCGNLKNHQEILTLLKGLPRSVVATEEEVLFFIEKHELMGKGTGYVDAHLLAATALDSSSRLWTRDKRLQLVAASLSLDFAID
jgi:predicted nucleic acid-binding protein